MMKFRSPSKRQLLNEGGLAGERGLAAHRAPEQPPGLGVRRRSLRSRRFRSGGGTPAQLLRIEAFADITQGVITRIVSEIDED